MSGTAGSHSTSDEVREFAPAKINLTLHVTGKRDDGYHLLDSLVVFADAGDWVAVASAPDGELSLRITGPYAEALCDEAVESNLVMRAARTLREWAAKRGRSQHGAALTLDKRLPVASGIGGGSADAAAALRALVRFWELGIPQTDLMEIALKLGADVPVCLRACPAVMRGIGEEIAPAPPLPDLWIVLVNPGVAVSTGGVFEALDLKAVSALGVPALPVNLLSADEAAAALKRCRNDLEPPARARAPQVADVLRALRRTKGALMARMSGSGATCFALYEDEESARTAAQALGADHPGWWVTAAKMFSA